jgi:vacuolar-type H+-ATPase subunit H
MTKTITVKLLRELKACESQVDKFIETFGKDAEVIPTMELAEKYGSEFNIHWLANILLNFDQRKVYDEAIAPAKKIYDEAIAPARKIYNKATTPAQKIYNKASAIAFVKAWNT